MLGKRQNKHLNRIENYIPSLKRITAYFFEFMCRFIVIVTQLHVCNDYILRRCQYNCHVHNLVEGHSMEVYRHYSIDDLAKDTAHWQELRTAIMPARLSGMRSVCVSPNPLQAGSSMQAEGHDLHARQGQQVGAQAIVPDIFPTKKKPFLCESNMRNLCQIDDCLYIHLHPRLIFLWQFKAPAEILLAGADCGARSCTNDNWFDFDMHDSQLIESSELSTFESLLEKSLFPPVWIAIVP